MTIWVDADACPVAIKEILFRAADRTGTRVTLVANQAMHVPRSRLVTLIQVEQGFDKADDEIARLVSAGDLVITSDIPLAAAVIEKDARVLTPRGERYTAGNIRARLSMRDFMDSLRSSGVDTGGPPTLSQRDRQAFANQLDQYLNRKSP